MITSSPDPVYGQVGMAVETVEFDGAHLMFVSGEIDTDTASTLADALGRCSVRRLLVDLSRVQFFDAAAITELLRSAQAQHDSGGSFRILSVSPFGRHVLELRDLVDVLGVRQDLGFERAEDWRRIERPVGGSCPTP